MSETFRRPKKGDDNEGAGAASKARLTVSLQAGLFIPKGAGGGVL